MFKVHISSHELRADLGQCENRRKNEKLKKKYDPKAIFLLTLTLFDFPNMISNGK